MTVAVRVAPLGVADEAAWSAFLAGRADATPYHGLVWRDIIQDQFGCETHYLLARDQQEQVQGILPLVRLQSRLFGDFLVSLPYVNFGGPLATHDSVETALLDAASELALSLRVSHIEFRERRTRAGNWATRTDKAAMVLALEPDADKQWGGLRSKVRAQIRRPQREGAEARRGGLELVPEFFRVYSRNMRDLGTPVYPEKFFADILRRFPEAAEVVIVDVGTVPAAAGLLISFGGTTEIPWAASNRAYNHIGVNMMLYWNCIQRAIERGSSRFDFGRSSWDSGTFRFKKQWGAEPVPMHWHYWLAQGGEMPGLTPSNPKYALAISAWKKLPVWLANTLGPMLVKNLP